MPIPAYADMMLPVLRALSDGEEHLVAHLREQVADDLGVTSAEREMLLPSGKQHVFNNRFYWAKTYLDKAGAVSTPRRGVVVITARGGELLRQNLERIDARVLDQFYEFRRWRRPSLSSGDADGADAVAERTIAPNPSVMDPEEAMETAFGELRGNVEGEILDALAEADPSVLERVVVDLLVALGYGGIEQAGQRLGRSGDGGVDGVIWEDRLGLERIYVQAKRWQSSVGRPEVQAFSGSLDGFRSRKGVFITTSSFTRDAQDYVGQIDKKIILIDGGRLARMLYETGVGVTTTRSFEVKRLDSDYFWEDS